MDIVLNITSPYPIHKIGKRVFQIDEIDYSKINKKTITSILDLGLKFIPNNNFKLSDLFYKTIKEVDTELDILNRKLIFFNNKNKNENKNNDIQSQTYIKESIKSF